ncbi:MAG: hypothetical protein ABI596_08760 [Pyrinomonadaceae bacterium]
MTQTSAQSRKLAAVRIPGLILLVALWSCACGGANSQNPKVEAPAPRSQPVAASQPPQIAKLPPQNTEVREVVNRIFKDAAVIDTSSNPNFIAGDFNGDLSQDIAVVLKPAPGKLSRMNEEAPPWILRDPFVTPQPGTPPLSVADNETLLAIIHGYGPNDWRDPQATQTYLLKNAVGSGMEGRAKNEFVGANQGRKLPRLKGDLIAEVLRGKPGYLYYDESAYSWYDPKTFKGEPERRLVHPGPRIQ